jgi:hypothetical protein
MSQNGTLKRTISLSIIQGYLWPKSSQLCGTINTAQKRPPVPRSLDYIMLVQFVQEVNKLDGCKRENRERGVEYKEKLFDVPLLPGRHHIRFFGGLFAASCFPVLRLCGSVEQQGSTFLQWP